MIIYTCILKISIIWINPVICHLLQNKVLTTSMSNLSFLDNECIKSSFMFQTLKKKKSQISNLKPEKLRKRPTHSSSSQHINFCKDTVCLLTLKCLFFKISCFLYSYTKFLMFLWQWNIMEFYNYIKKLPLPKKQYLLCVHS